MKSKSKKKSTIISLLFFTSVLLFSFKLKHKNFNEFLYIKLLQNNNKPLTIGKIIIVNNSEDFMIEKAKYETGRIIKINKKGISKISFKKIKEEYSEGLNYVNAYFINEQFNNGYKFKIDLTKDTNVIIVN